MEEEEEEVVGAKGARMVPKAAVRVLSKEEWEEREGEHSEEMRFSGRICSLGVE